MKESFQETEERKRQEILSRNGWYGVEVKTLTQSKTWWRMRWNKANELCAYFNQHGLLKDGKPEKVFIVMIVIDDDANEGERISETW